MMTCRAVLFTMCLLPIFSWIENANSNESITGIPNRLPPIQISYFGNNSTLPTGIESLRQQADIKLIIYNLDDHQNLEKELSRDFPKNKNNKENTLEIARQRLRAISPERFRAVFEGQLKAKEWRLRRFPAVVFGDGDSVIYGVTDLEACHSIWLSSRTREVERAR